MHLITIFYAEEQNLEPDRGESASSEYSFLLPYYL